MESFIQQLYNHRQKLNKFFPDRMDVASFIDDFFVFLFLPTKQHDFSRLSLSTDIEVFNTRLQLLVNSVLCNNEYSKKVTDEFFTQLPILFELLLKDANATLEGDPAAKSMEEVLIAYPGFFAIVVHRISNQLLQQGVSILPRLFAEYAHSKTGIDIHPGATIGNSFFIDHGTGIVIGETTIIGDNVKIYQGVTLGALSVNKSEASKKRHPTIEDKVVIYSGATILGGETIIGKNSIIGGNVWLTQSLPADSIAYHKSEIFIKDKNSLPDVINFVI